MIHRILMVAVFAGFAAGVAVTAMQAISVLPLIEKAERIEMGLPLDEPAATPSEDRTTDPTRFSGTLMANVLTGVGFGLLLVAGYAMAGVRIDLWRGLLWGLGGFLAVALLPAISLPPEPPGAPGVPLAAARTWWLTTMALGAAALLMLAYARPWPFKVLAVALLVAPHIYGAPQPAGAMDPALAEMAGDFAAASLTSTAVFWSVLGAVSGALYPRLAGGGATPPT